MSETSEAKISATLGMWIFLGSELLLFAGLFLPITVYRHLYPAVFTEGTRHLSVALGTINTAILLTSSACVAWGLEKARRVSPRPWFLATLAFGALFLVLKGVEYHEHYAEGLFPAFNWDAQKFTDPRLELFFTLYFVTTGLHAFHLILGLSWIAWLTLKSGSADWRERHEALLENGGLYWHFVDVIWIFVFPLLYLIGRS